MKTRVAIVGVLLLAGCNGESGTEPPAPIAELPRDLTTGETHIIQRANDFGFELLSQVAQAEDSPNIVLSPLSASMALGMLLNGASGETFDEMRDALSLAGMDQQAINDAYAGLIEMLSGLDPAVRFDIANSVWTRQGVAFHDPFEQRVTSHFDAQVRAIDFSSPDAASLINEWVADATNGRIETMVDDIDPLDVMFLLNAIYFNGDWATQFDSERTEPGDFTTGGGATVQVPMMSMLELPHLFARRPDGVKVLELPYGGGAFAMVFVLPPGDAFEYAATLSRAEWDALVGALDTVDVLVRMPKYTLRYERELNDDLRALGMEQAFDAGGGADFDRLTDEYVYVSLVRQKTFLNVDEQGTEAAAVTSVGVRTVSLGPHIYLDRPFVFAIRERLSGTILFLGVIGDPTAGGE